MTTPSRGFMPIVQNVQCDTCVLFFVGHCLAMESFYRLIERGVGDRRVVQ